MFQWFFFFFCSLNWKQKKIWNKKKYHFDFLWKVAVFKTISWKMCLVAHFCTVFVNFIFRNRNQTIQKTLVGIWIHVQICKNFYWLHYTKYVHWLALVHFCFTRDKYKLAFIKLVFILHYLSKQRLSYVFCIGQTNVL